MSDRSIITAVQKMAGVFKKDNVSYVIAKVKSVSGNKCSVITVTDDTEVTIEDVLLQTEVCDGLLITPKKDSNVLVALSVYNPPYIAMFSDIDEFYLQVGDSSVTVKNNGKIQFNDGSYGSLIKIQDLVTKLNNIENLLNQFIGIYNSHTHTNSAGTTTTPSAPETQTLTPTQLADIENNLITHGKI